MSHFKNMPDENGGNDAYYGIGSARFWSDGTVAVANTDGTYEATYSANITMYKFWDFTNDSHWYSPTAAGLRLQNHGYVEPFNVNAYYKETYIVDWKE